MIFGLVNSPGMHFQCMERRFRPLAYCIGLFCNILNALDFPIYLIPMKNNTRNELRFKMIELDLNQMECSNHKSMNELYLKLCSSFYVSKKNISNSQVAHSLNESNGKV